MQAFIRLKNEIDQCNLCADHLPLGPRPVYQAHPDAKILVVGQAPGTAVHKTGIPFNDPSGDRLRQWMGVSKDVFYDPRQIALVPMGFCYPGRGTGGDLPPRPECANTWRKQLLEHLSRVELTLAIGRYAIDWHLSPGKQLSLTKIVTQWNTYGPDVIPLPHPSPRNTLWLRKNPIVESEIIPVVQTQVARLLSGTG